MMWQGVCEAAVNLALSITLTLVFRSILGVAIGSVIPTVLFGWGLLWGWAAKEAQMTRCSLFRQVVLPAWLGCLPMIGVALALRFQPWWISGGNTALVLVEGAVVGATGLAGIWLFALSAPERTRLATRFRRRRPPSATPAKA